MKPSRKKPPKTTISARGALSVALLVAVAFGGSYYFSTASSKGPLQVPMADIPAGEFWMGTEHAQMPDSRPVHKVYVDAFSIDKTEVTNAQYGRFVRVTGYKTVAEQTPNAEDFPGAKPEDLVPGAVVFTPPSQPVPLDSHFRWWSYRKYANWRHPEGPESTIDDRMNHPVVEVAWEDADAFCRWAGKRLPTEAEFEFAARGGLDRQPFTWGSEFAPGGRQMANIFQGNFPHHNTRQDGYSRTAPVGSFPPNGYGLYDMAGNVWEWVSDWYRADTFALDAASGQVVRNPVGPSASLDPSEPGVKKRVMKGGSFLCTDQYCSRYMPGGRGKGDVFTGTDHLGFRCASPRR